MINLVIGSTLSGVKIVPKATQKTYFGQLEIYKLWPQL